MARLMFFKKGDLPIKELVKEENVYWEEFASIDEAAERLNELLIQYPDLLKPNPGIKLNGLDGNDDVKNAQKFAYTLLTGMYEKGNRKARYKEYKEFTTTKKDLWLTDIKYEKGEIKESKLKDFERVRIRILQEANKLGGKKL